MIGVTRAGCEPVAPERTRDYPSGGSPWPGRDRVATREETTMRLDVSIEVEARPEAVWEVLTDWERQSEWMLDARSVEVVTPHREGEGVTIVVPTNLLGFTVEDRMRVTGWEAPRRLEVIHLGRVIRGSGAFAIDELGPGRSRLTWTEEVDPPLGALGEWGASTLVRPVVERIFRRSLRNLAALAEASARS